MAFRVLFYMVQIWELQRREWISKGVPKSEWRFSPIIPIVYYTGDRRWKTPLTLDTAMELPDVLRRFVPQFDILFLGVKETSKETLTQTNHPFGWLMTVLQKEHASQEEIKSALIDAMSRIKNILGEDQVEQWTMALYYLLVLIQHRRPAEERGDWDIFFVEYATDGKEINLMKTIADIVYAEAEERGLERGIKQGREEGREEGERNGTIASILTLLGIRFQSDAVQALKPTLDTIDDLSRLKELLIAASDAQSVEAFTQILHE